MTIIGFTGHRDLFSDERELIKNKLIEILEEKKPEKCISGMAIGYDILAAECCIELGIPFIAAIPFKGQEQMWNEYDKLKYSAYLLKACEVKYVCGPGFANYKYHLRDEWIVDSSDLMVALYKHTGRGGTYHTLEYAKVKNKPIINIYDVLNGSDK